MVDNQVVGIPSSYNVKELSLTNARTDEEIKIPGNYIAAYTDGSYSGLYIKLNDPNSDLIPLYAFNHLLFEFDRIFLTSTAQSDKTLTLFFGRNTSVSSAGQLPADSGDVKVREQGNPRFYLLDEYGNAETLGTDITSTLSSSILDHVNENAARLWSPTSFRRTGRVLWMDSFSNGLGSWYQAASGSGSDINIDGNTGVTGSCSARLVCGTTGNMSAQLQTYIPCTISGKAAISVIFSFFGGIVDTSYMYLTATVSNVDTGTSTYGIRWYTDDSVYYYSANNTYVAMSDIPALSAGHKIFSMLKLVFDPASKKYDKLVTFNQATDMSTINAYTAGTSYYGYVTIIIGFIGNSTNITRQHIDSVILTDSET